MDKQRLQELAGIKEIKLKVGSEFTTKLLFEFLNEFKYEFCEFILDYELKSIENFLFKRINISNADEQSLRDPDFYREECLYELDSLPFYYEGEYDGFNNDDNGIYWGYDDNIGGRPGGGLFPQILFNVIKDEDIEEAIYLGYEKMTFKGQTFYYLEY